MAASACPRVHQGRDASHGMVSQCEHGDFAMPTNAHQTSCIKLHHDGCITRAGRGCHVLLRYILLELVSPVRWTKISRQSGSRASILPIVAKAAISRSEPGRWTGPFLFDRLGPAGTLNPKSVGEILTCFHSPFMVQSMDTRVARQHTS